MKSVWQTVQVLATFAFEGSDIYTDILFYLSLKDGTECGVDETVPDWLELLALVSTATGVVLFLLSWYYIANRDKYSALRGFRSPHVQIGILLSILEDGVQIFCVYYILRFIGMTPTQNKKWTFWANLVLSSFSWLRRCLASAKYFTKPSGRVHPAECSVNADNNKWEGVVVNAETSKQAVAASSGGKERKPETSAGFFSAFKNKSYILYFVSVVLVLTGAYVAIFVFGDGFNFEIVSPSVEITGSLNTTNWDNSFQLSTVARLDTSDITPRQLLLPTTRVWDYGGNIWIDQSERVKSVIELTLSRYGANQGNFSGTITLFIRDGSLGFCPCEGKFLINGVEASDGTWTIEDHDTLIPLHMSDDCKGGPKNAELCNLFSMEIPLFGVSYVGIPKGPNTKEFGCTNFRWIGPLCEREILDAYGSTTANIMSCGGAIVRSSYSDSGVFLQGSSDLEPSEPTLIEGCYHRNGVVGVSFLTYDEFNVSLSCDWEAAVSSSANANVNDVGFEMLAVGKIYRVAFHRGSGAVTVTFESGRSAALVLSEGNGFLVDCSEDSNTGFTGLSSNTETLVVLWENGSVPFEVIPATDSPTPTPSNTPSLTGSSTQTPSWTQTPSTTPTNSPSLSTTPTNTASFSRTGTETTTTTGTPTRSPSLSGTKSGTATHSGTPTSTVSGTASLSQTGTYSPSASTTPTVSPTKTATVSRTPSASGSTTSTPSLSGSLTATSSFTPSPSKTPSMTLTTSATISKTPSHTGTGTNTASNTGSKTVTPSTTVTSSYTASVSSTTSVSPSYTPSTTRTPSNTPTTNPSPSRTSSPSYTVTPSTTGTPPNYISIKETNTLVQHGNVFAVPLDGVFHASQRLNTVVEVANVYNPPGSEGGLSLVIEPLSFLYSPYRRGTYTQAALTIHDYLVYAIQGASASYIDVAKVDRSAGTVSEIWTTADFSNVKALTNSEHHLYIVDSDIGVYRCHISDIEVLSRALCNITMLQSQLTSVQWLWKNLEDGSPLLAVGDSSGGVYIVSISGSGTHNVQGSVSVSTTNHIIYFHSSKHSNLLLAQAQNDAAAIIDISNLFSPTIVFNTVNTDDIWGSCMSPDGRLYLVVAHVSSNTGTYVYFDSDDDGTVQYFGYHTYNWRKIYGCFVMDNTYHVLLIGSDMNVKVAQTIIPRDEISTTMTLPVYGTQNTERGSFDLEGIYSGNGIHVIGGDDNLLAFQTRYTYVGTSVRGPVIHTRQFAHICEYSALSQMESEDTACGNWTIVASNTTINSSDRLAVPANSLVSFGHSTNISVDTPFAIDISSAFHRTNVSDTYVKLESISEPQSLRLRLSITLDIVELDFNPYHSGINYPSAQSVLIANDYVIYVVLSSVRHLDVCHLDRSMNSLSRLSTTTDFTGVEGLAQAGDFLYVIDATVGIYKCFIDDLADFQQGKCNLTIRRERFTAMAWTGRYLNIDHKLFVLGDWEGNLHSFALDDTSDQVTLLSSIYLGFDEEIVDIHVAASGNYVAVQIDDDRSAIVDLTDPFVPVVVEFFSTGKGVCTSPEGNVVAVISDGAEDRGINFFTYSSSTKELASHGYFQFDTGNVELCAFLSSEYDLAVLTNGVELYHIRFQFEDVSAPFSLDDHIVSSRKLYGSRFYTEGLSAHNGALVYVDSNTVSIYTLHYTLFGTVNDSTGAHEPWIANVCEVGAVVQANMHENRACEAWSISVQDVASVPSSRLAIAADHHESSGLSSFISRGELFAVNLPTVFHQSSVLDTTIEADSITSVEAVNLGLSISLNTVTLDFDPYHPGTTYPHAQAALIIGDYVLFAVKSSAYHLDVCHLNRSTNVLSKLSTTTDFTGVEGLAYADEYIYVIDSISGVYKCLVGDLPVFKQAKCFLVIARPQFTVMKWTGKYVTGHQKLFVLGDWEGNIHLIALDDDRDDVTLLSSLYVGYDDEIVDIHVAAGGNIIAVQTDEDTSAILDILDPTVPRLDYIFSKGRGVCTSPDGNVIAVISDGSGSRGVNLFTYSNVTKNLTDHGYFHFDIGYIHICSFLTNEYDLVGVTDGVELYHFRFQLPDISDSFSLLDHIMSSRHLYSSRFYSEGFSAQNGALVYVDSSTVSMYTLNYLVSGIVSNTGTTMVAQFPSVRICEVSSAVQTDQMTNRACLHWNATITNATVGISSRLQLHEHQIQDERADINTTIGNTLAIDIGDVFHQSTVLDTFIEVDSIWGDTGVIDMQLASVLDTVVLDFDPYHSGVEYPSAEATLMIGDYVLFAVASSERHLDVCFLNRSTNILSRISTTNRFTGVEGLAYAEDYFYIVDSVSGVYKCHIDDLVDLKPKLCNLTIASSRFTAMVWTGKYVNVDQKLFVLGDWEGNIHTMAVDDVRGEATLLNSVFVGYRDEIHDLHVAADGDLLAVQVDLDYSALVDMSDPFNLVVDELLRDGKGVCASPDGQVIILITDGSGKHGMNVFTYSFVHDNITRLGYLRFDNGYIWSCAFLSNEYDLILMTSDKVLFHLRFALHDLTSSFPVEDFVVYSRRMNSPRFYTEGVSGHNGAFVYVDSSTVSMYTMQYILSGTVRDDAIESTSVSARICEVGRALQLYQVDNRACSVWTLNVQNSTEVLSSALHLSKQHLEGAGYNSNMSRGLGFSEGVYGVFHLSSVKDTIVRYGGWNGSTSVNSTLSISLNTLASSSNVVPNAEDGYVHCSVIIGDMILAGVKTVDGSSVWRYRVDRTDNSVLVPSPLDGLSSVEGLTYADDYVFIVDSSVGVYRCSAKNFESVELEDCFLIIHRTLLTELRWTGRFYNEDGKLFAAGDWNGNVHLIIINDKTGQETLISSVFTGYTDEVVDLDVAASGNVIVVQVDDDRSVLIDISDAQTPSILYSHSSYVKGSCTSPDGKVIAVITDGSGKHGVNFYTVSNATAEVRYRGYYEFSSAYIYLCEFISSSYDMIVVSSEIVFYHLQLEFDSIPDLGDIDNLVVSSYGTSLTSSNYYFEGMSFGNGLLFFGGRYKFVAYSLSYNLLGSVANSATPGDVGTASLCEVPYPLTMFGNQGEACGEWSITVQ